MEINPYLLILALILSGLISKTMFKAAYHGVLEAEIDRDRSNDYLSGPKFLDSEKVGDSEYPLRYLAYIPPFLFFISAAMIFYFILFLIYGILSV